MRIFGVLAAVLLCAAQLHAPGPARNVHPQIGCGYANADGSQIIALSETLGGDRTLIEYTYAVGEGAYPIVYDRFQEGDGEDTGRQTAVNFDHEPGCIYRVLEGTAVPDETCLLLTQAAYERADILERVESRAPAVPDSLTASCAALAGRPVKDDWLLAEYGNGLRVSMVEFERRGADLLAWLVLEEGETLAYCAFPATLSGDGYTGWRVGDCGELDRTALYALAALQDQRGTVVYLGWRGEEMELVKAVSFFTGEAPSAETVGGRYVYPV